MSVPSERESIFEASQYPVKVLSFWQKEPVVSQLQSHPELEIQFVHHGKGSFFIHDTLYPVVGKSVLVIDSDVVHNFVVDPGDSIKKASLMVSPDILADSPLALSIVERLCTTRFLKLSSKQEATAEFLLEEIRQETESQENNYATAIRNHLESLLILLDRAAQGPAPEPSGDNTLIQEIIRHLEQSFDDEVTLGDVASRFGLSAGHLSTTFKHYVGIGFKEYLIHRRISEAKKLLKTTSLKVATIAFQVGFESLSAFYRDFQLVTGLSPNEYRKIVSSTVSEFLSNIDGS